LYLHRDLPEIKDFKIADGKMVTVVKEGNSSETLVLGTGNGDGIANPGESVIILAGDSGKLWRTKVIVSDKYVNPSGISIRKSDYWGTYDHVGESAKFSVPVIASSMPGNHIISFLVEYWLPDYPNHIIKRGKVSLQIAGKDNTPPQLQWVRIPGNNVIQIKVYDGADISSVKARLFNKDKKDQDFEAVLLDNGIDGDVTANDNVFSYTIPDRRFGLYSAEVTATDSSGNTATYKDPGLFVIH